jgi:hypothetical protein
VLDRPVCVICSGKAYHDVDWSQLVQNREQWRALGEHGNEHSGSMNVREFLRLVVRQLVPQGGLLCSMELVRSVSLCRQQHGDAY